MKLSSNLTELFIFVFVISLLSIKRFGLIESLIFEEESIFLIVLSFFWFWLLLSWLISEIIILWFFRMGFSSILFILLEFSLILSFKSSNDFILLFSFLINSIFLLTSSFLNLSPFFFSTYFLLVFCGDFS